MQLLIITYHIDMYIIIIIMPNNKIIDLIVSLQTATYSINCRLFFYEYTVVYTNLQITVHSLTNKQTKKKNNFLRFIE